MKKLTKSLIAAGLVLSASNAVAGSISAGGITWDPNATDPRFNAAIEFTQWFTTLNTTTRTDYGSNVATTGLANPLTLTGGEELVGVGEILSINSDSFCNNCELTFSFGGITFNDPQQNPSSAFDFTNGWINVYVDKPLATDHQNTNIPAVWTTPAFATEVGNAVDGDLWLSLGFEDAVFFGVPFSGTINAGLMVEDTGGLAKAEAVFDQDSIVSPFFGTDLFDALGTNFSTTFGKLLTDGVLVSDTGSGNLTANPVSSPATLAIFGIGLMGVGFASRRKSAQK